MCEAHKPKKHKKYVRKSTAKPRSEWIKGGVRPLTEAEKDLVAESILLMYQGFVDKGCFTPDPPAPKKDHIGSTSQEEGDLICGMVVSLLENIKRKIEQDA